MDFKGKRVILLGAGKSNAAVMEYAYNMGAEIELREYDKERVSEEFYKYCRKIKTGGEYADNMDCDILVRTPIMRPDLPEIKYAVKNGAAVTSEVQLFFEITKAKIIAVTGSSGKTTTTKLIYEMLKKSGRDAYIGGNVGIPLMKYTDLSENDIIAAELSSFQLMDLKKSPHTAVVTNIYPNHLDVHKDMEEYIAAKRNIVRYSPKRTVLNYDDETVRGFDGGNERVYFSMKSDKTEVYYKDGWICLYDSKFFDTSEMKILGEFNIKNYMAAMAAVSGICAKDGICAAAAEFSGAEHRNEFVAELDGVSYYDSSIDSSPDRTAATLSAYNQKVILLAGGRGKGVPYDLLESVFRDKVRLLITAGENAEELGRVAEKSGVVWIRADNYAEAVEFAKRKARKGDKAVLSPASTSFDSFRNFEERGEFFKRCVLGDK